MRPVLERVREAANYRNEYRATLVTAATGVATRIWESEQGPTSGLWQVTFTLLGLELGAGDCFSSGRYGAFLFTTATVAQVGATTSAFNHASGIATTPAFGVDTTARTVYVTVNDDAVGTVNWYAVISVLEVA